jgi:hypothetical protein
VRYILATMLGVALAATPALPGSADPVPLTNLAHLDFLTDAVAPPDQPGHTTYRLAEQPAVGVLWTYAEPGPDGSYRRIGGGAYDPATDTYGQGAFNADDVSRAAVVYLRHWQQTGTAGSREAAYQLLRGLTYLQTATGPDAGNVVLWMQPDGTLHPSADPPELPDPSDSADSYWLARTLWALGEGYAAFAPVDPEFAAFLGGRFRLALGAVERQPLSRYGQWLRIDGERAPAWLIAGGADATGEALLGLSAYVSATGDDRARRVRDRLAEGVEAMRAGTPYAWPYGAILPWTLSRAVWHAWGGLAPAGLAAAGGARTAVLSDAASFTPHLLVAGGPENGWLPAPVERTQIAYGAHSRVESLLRASDVYGRPGLADLAGIAAGWFFGDNPAGTAMYDPATGRTYDGVAGNGDVNRNSGAESTIHGLLTMLLLDGRTELITGDATVQERHTWRLVEAETGTLSGAATVHTPESAWTGESLWSGGAGVALRPGGQVRFEGELTGRSRLMPVVELAPGAGSTRWPSAGVLRHGEVGPQGDSPAPGLLSVTTLPAPVRSGPVTVTGTTGTALVDAVLVQPELEWLVRDGATLVRSFASGPRVVELPVPAGSTVSSYDPTGRLVSESTATDPRARITVPPGGFAIAIG